MKQKKHKAELSLKERFTALKNIPKFLKLIWETSRSLTLVNISLRVIKAMCAPAILYVGKIILDSIVAANRGDTKDVSSLWTWIGVEVALVIASDALSRLMSYFDSLLGDLFANHTSVSIMKHAATLELEQFEDSNFYDKLERARQQTVSRTVLLSQIFAQFQDLITVFFLAVVLIAFNPWLIILLILTVLPVFLGEMHFNEQSYSMITSWTPERRELDYLRYIGTSDETAKEVKAFDLSHFLIARFIELSDKFYILNKKLALKRASWCSFLSAIGTATYYLAYIFIIFDTVKGSISIGDFTFYTASFHRLKSLLEGVFLRISSISQSSLYLKDLFDFFQIKPKSRIPKKYCLFPKPIKEGFYFENVSFKYSHSEKFAVKNITFRLKPGEKLALVGENGAGKTTLTKLISKLYEPTEGRILIDGIDIQDIDPVEIRNNMGVIFQDYVRFQFTASNNIAVGDISQKGDGQKIKNAAIQSLADYVISNLPKKYDQMIGKRFADGVELSGGEWQKVALARAYMRDAQVLILDEPTASLDARAEHEVFLRFAELTAGKTALLISHRFSTVRMADRIMLLENGEMKELGTHQELLEKNGKYASLFYLQAKGYM